MKKIISIVLVLVLSIFMLTACGSSKPDQTGVASSGTGSVDLVDVTTELNVTLKLPKSMTKQDPYFYADTNTSDSATIIADISDGSPLSDFSQEDFVDFMFADYDDLVITSFDNDLTINGNKALVCEFSFTSNEGNGITGAIVYVTYKNAEYSIAFLHSSDNKDSALAKSLQTCIDSITINY